MLNSFAVFLMTVLLILKSSNITVGTSNLQYWGPVLTPLLNILLFLQLKVSNVSKTHLSWYLKESETVYIKFFGNGRTAKPKCKWNRRKKEAIWHSAIWKIGVLVNFIIQKSKSKHLVCLSLLWWQVFLREREKTFNILHIFRV